MGSLVSSSQMGAPSYTLGQVCSVFTFNDTALYFASFGCRLGGTCYMLPMHLFVVIRDGYHMAGSVQATQSWDLLNRKRRESFLRLGIRLGTEW